MVDDMEKEFAKSVKESKSQAEMLNEQIDTLERENAELKRVLWEYGIEEIGHISDEEYICIKELERLRELSERIGLNEQEVRMFDLINKNLRMIRNGVEKKTPKGKTLGKDELLKIVDGGKKDV